MAIRLSNRWVRIGLIGGVGLVMLFAIAYAMFFMGDKGRAALAELPKSQRHRDGACR